MDAREVDSTGARPVAARVFRRRVFYIPGYDPIPARRYRELYRKEGAAQARLSGYALTLAPRTGGGPYGWRVTGRMEGGEAEAQVDVLVWSDIVRGSMSNSIPATYWQLVTTAWAYIGSGALFRLMRLRGGPMVAALYPIGVLIAQLLVTLAVASGLGLAAGLVHPAAGWAVAAVATVLGLRWWKARDGRIYAYYLMHDYAYSARSGGANPPELEARMAEFRARIRAALDEGPDEVLVVGHSSGAHLGVSILADLLREGGAPAGTALSFLSLGQVIPMVSFLPRATRLRADLAWLSLQEGLTWIDVTAPGDGCAFALCDPVAVTGVAPPGKRWPLVLSAAFKHTLSPPLWAATRRKYFRMHFQYLCAFDALPGRADDYDYFRITAGPRTLAARLGSRRPSPSRIERPVNRHTRTA
jgi:hypothetical protein